MINEDHDHLKSQRVVGESVTNQTWNCRVICFLRDLDFSVNKSKTCKENREQVLELLLSDQIESLEKSSEK